MMNPSNPLGNTRDGSKDSLVVQGRKPVFGNLVAPGSQRQGP